MHFITKEKLLSLFDGKTPNTFNEFINKTHVRNNKRLIPLKEYILSNHINKTDIKQLYENIKNRNEYLERLYNTSLALETPETLKITDPPMKNRKMNNNISVHYKNVIRNLFYKEILQDTQSGLNNNPSFFTVLDELYNKNIIDYKILTPSAIFYMKNGRLGSVFSSFYFRASIMNPYLVYSLNHSVLKGTRIFTPTLGWCSYCYGMLECPYVVEYVGTDVIKKVCDVTKQFADTYYSEKQVTIYCKPSEDLYSNPSFMKKYKNHFDVVFFSPPYYELELYPGTNQSTRRYQTYEKWLSEYWEKTIQLCHHVLIPNGKMCYILSGYGSENTSKKYDLLNDMNTISKKYFQLHSSQKMYNKNVHVTQHRETDEKIMIFTK